MSSYGLLLVMSMIVVVAGFFVVNSLPSFFDITQRNLIYLFMISISVIVPVFALIKGR